MSTLKTAKMAVTAQELAVARQALEALKLTPPTPPPETITLVSAVGELAIKIRELSRAGYSYEQIATCIKLGGIQMDAPKLRRYLNARNKRLTKKARDKKAVPTVVRAPKQTGQTQQTVVQGTTPTLAAPQTKPTPGPSAILVASAVVPPTYRPAAAVTPTPPTPSALALQAPSTNLQQNSAPVLIANQTVAPPSISRLQNAASPVAPSASAHPSYPQTSDGSERTASGGRTSNLSTTEQKPEGLALLRQASIAVREQALTSASAAQTRLQTEGSAPTDLGIPF